MKRNHFSRPLSFSLSLPLSVYLSVSLSLTLSHSLKHTLSLTHPLSPCVYFSPTFSTSDFIGIGERVESSAACTTGRGYA